MSQDIPPRIRSMDEIRHGLVELVRLDERLATLVSKISEVPLRLEEPGFGGLARIIIAQQVSTASAAAIHGRFQKLIQPMSAEAYLEAGEPAWIEIGLSRPKQKTFSNLCAEIVSGRLNLDNLGNLPTDDAMASLTAVSGIGPWTAEVYLLFSTGHPDIFPAGDLALQEAVKVALDLDERPDDKMTRQIAEQWSPWRGVAARLMWSYYRELKQGREGIL